MRKIALFTAAATALFAALPATAEQMVTSQAEFVELTQGKTLTRPLVRLEVMPSGKIEGRGAAWDVSGTWSWKDGFFCRDLFWGGDALGYNCQQVTTHDGSIRFTSDRGAGDSAAFRLN